MKVSMDFESLVNELYLAPRDMAEAYLLKLKKVCLDYLDNILPLIKEYAITDLPSDFFEQMRVKKLDMLNDHLYRLEFLFKTTRRGGMLDSEFTNDFMTIYVAVTSNFLIKTEEFAAIPSRKELSLKEPVLYTMFLRGDEGRDAYFNYDKYYFYLADSKFNMEISQEQAEKLLVGTPITIALDSQSPEIHISLNEQVSPNTYRISGYAHRLSIEGHLYLQFSKPVLQMASEIDFQFYDDSHNLLSAEEVYSQSQNAEHFALKLLSHVLEEIRQHKLSGDSHYVNAVDKNYKWLFLSGFEWRETDVIRKEFTDLIVKKLSIDSLQEYLEKLDISIILDTLKRYVFIRKLDFDKLAAKMGHKECKIYSLVNDFRYKHFTREFTSNLDIISYLTQYFCEEDREVSKNELLGLFYVKYVLYKYCGDLIYSMKDDFQAYYHPDTLEEYEEVAERINLQIRKLETLTK